MTQIQYINSQDQLQSFCQRLSNSPWVTLDTEFLREKTYHPQLCLVQLANTEEIACVDPLAIDDLSPLYDLLENPNIVKVVHAGSQDLDIFYRLMGKVPTPIFDSQVAASLLGYGDQIGYGRLVEQICKIQLDKSQSRTDWSRRPLSQKQIDYAADDVRHLRDIYLFLHEKLISMGRLDWLEKDFDDLTNPARYESVPLEMWKKVKQHGRLKGVELAILQRLAAWREEKALDRNRPRRWIASDDLLIDISRTKPTSIDDLSALRSAEAGFVANRGNFILKLVKEAKQTPKDEWPKVKDYKPLTVAQDALIDYLMAAAKLKAAEHEITLSNLVSKKELEKLIQGQEDTPVMKSWRYTLLGKDLSDLLNGKSMLVPSQSGLSLKHTE